VQNPFGQAKPRESILATRTGKKEEDILRDELLKEKLKVAPLPSANLAGRPIRLSPIVACTSRKMDMVPRSAMIPSGKAPIISSSRLIYHPPHNHPRDTLKVLLSSSHPTDANNSSSTVDFATENFSLSLHS